MRVDRGLSDTDDAAHTLRRSYSEARVAWRECLWMFAVIGDISMLSSFITHEDNGYRSIANTHSTQWYMTDHSVEVSMVTSYKERQWNVFVVLTDFRKVKIMEK
jgi:thiaminase